MKLKVIVHEAEGCGYWAEVPAIPGCDTQGESIDELLNNLGEAIAGCLSVDFASITMTEKDYVIDIRV
jgi:predicted RNase H-like HicB family nuclease